MKRFLRAFAVMLVVAGSLAGPGLLTHYLASELVSNNTSLLTIQIAHADVPSDGNEFSINDRVKVVDKQASIRKTVGGKWLGYQQIGSEGIVTSGPQFANNVWWWKVNFDTGYDGWASGVLLVEVPASTTTPPTPTTTPTTSTKFNINDRITVSSGPVSVRDAITGTWLGYQQTGVNGTVVGGPLMRSFWGWFIDYDTGLDGWSPENSLTKLNPPSSTASTAVKIVVIGSSSAAGKNLVEDGALLSDRWSDRLAMYLSGIRPGSTVVNLAVPGTDTYYNLPTGTINPTGKPAVDTTHNITAALALNPDAIIISHPADANKLSLTEAMANLQTIVATANAAGVQVWIATSQPIITNASTANTNIRLSYRTAIMQTYGTHALDFWSPMVNPDDTAIPSLLTAYDGIHPSAAGHLVLFEQIKAANIPSIVKP